MTRPSYPRRPVSTPLPLLTEHLELREPRMADAPALFQDVYGDPEVMRWVAGGPLVDLAATREALATFRAHQRAHGFTWWTVVERATEAGRGRRRIVLLRGHRARRRGRLHVRPRRVGPGVRDAGGDRIARGRVRAAGAPRVLAVVRPGNGASQRVLEKAGMRRDGRTDYRGAEHVRFVAERDAWSSS